MNTFFRPTLSFSLYLLINRDIKAEHNKLNQFYSIATAHVHGDIMILISTLCCLFNYNTSHSHANPTILANANNILNPNPQISAASTRSLRQTRWHNPDWPVPTPTNHSPATEYYTAAVNNHNTCGALIVPALVSFSASQNKTVVNPVAAPLIRRHSA